MFQPEKDHPENVSQETASLVNAIEEARDFRPTLEEFSNPFSHPALLQNLEESSVVRKEDLINQINYLHFIERPLYLYLRGASGGAQFIIPALTEPCDGDKCTCFLPWDKEAIYEKYAIQYIFVPSGQHVLIVPTHIQLLEDSSIAIQLPKKSYRVNLRRNQRYDGGRMSAVLYQNAFQASGELRDFSPSGLKIRLSDESNSSVRWFNQELPVLLHLAKGDRMVFTSLCHCIRFERRHSGEQHIVLAPGNLESPQFVKQKLRSPRQQLTPSFSVNFQHPFLTKRVSSRQVHDITTSGFSVEEDIDDSLLLPGLIISDLDILYANVFEIKCQLSQVVYRKELPAGRVRCGVAILDMDIENYTKLANILSNALDPHAQISCKVEAEDLWKFFFESGFIYPKKYRSIHLNRVEFKRTYEKLYRENPDILRHFTYQKDGRIYGHISLVRAYDKSWMFHHLSAKSIDGRRAGPLVMKQITHFTHDLHRFPSACMDHMLCYYQPGNRFSSFLFGGFAKKRNDPKICSEDRFAYWIHPKINSRRDLPSDWSLARFRPSDLFELRQFYMHYSGGLLLDVLKLDAAPGEMSEAEKAYARSGFTRKTEQYSLYHEGTLAALLLVNQTDFGFNLSNLLNCLKIIICTPKTLPWNILMTAVDKLVSRFPSENVPVMTFPSDYIVSNEVIRSAKEYVMWIIDARHVGDFMVTTKKQSKIGHWE